MRRLAGVYENGFEMSFSPMQRVFFFKLGSMAWVLEMNVRRSNKGLKSVYKTYVYTDLQF